MRKTTLTLLTLLLLTAATATGKKPQKIGAPYAWTVSDPLGDRKAAVMDTSYINYSLGSVPSGLSPAWACTGNYGGPGINMIWMDRRAPGSFYYENMLDAWRPTLAKQKFYNTRVPMTLLSFNTGGGKETSQDRLTGVFSGNINKNAQVGATLDYLYSKGSYDNQNAKDLCWGFNGSYIGEKFEFQGFYNHWNMVNRENGGITDDRYITDPEEVQGGVSSINPKAIPTRLTAAQSRIVGGQLFLNSRYKLGKWHEEMRADSSVSRTYIPVTSFIWTLNYCRGRHVFVNEAPGEAADFWANTYFTPDGTYDKTTFSTLTNTFGISMVEGWHKLAKFGLTAYITHQLRKYTQSPDTVVREMSPLPENAGDIPGSVSANRVWVGGKLSKTRGSLLTYEANARFGVIGSVAGNVRLEGSIRTRFRLFGDSVSITANGGFRNENTPYLYNHYRSNHFIWEQSLGTVKTVTVGGRLDIPHTGSILEANVQNITDYAYFGTDAIPTHYSGSIQVLSLRLKQRLSWRSLHWDNTIVWQKSGKEDILSLPQLSVYSNLYLTVRIATLKLQLGLDCDWYTKYYAPNYQPATMAFYNQREIKIGNYPFMNLYANMRLSRARFFVMMTHINQGLCGKNYFVLPGYPLNPRRFQLGVSVDFAN